MIDIDHLRKLIAYDSATGNLTWLQRMSDKVRPGDLAGSKRKDGYIAVRILGMRFLGHRIAWAIHTGGWPKYNIDHINGNPSDNRISNLRDIDQRSNLQNLYKARSHNKLGFLGVVRDKKRYVAKIGVNGKSIRIGIFTTPEDAHAAYLIAKNKYHIPQIKNAILAGQPVANARIVRKDRLTIK